MLSWPNVDHRVGGEPLLALAAHAIICHMPVPTNQRRALERERDELPAHVTNYQRELDAPPQASGAARMADQAGGEGDGGGSCKIDGGRPMTSRIAGSRPVRIRCLFTNPSAPLTEAMRRYVSSE